MWVAHLLLTNRGIDFLCVESRRKTSEAKAGSQASWPQFRHRKECDLKKGSGLRCGGFDLNRFSVFTVLI